MNLKKTFSAPLKYLLLSIIAGLSIYLLIIDTPYNFFSNPHIFGRNQLVFIPSLTPWQSIGGCGASSGNSSSEEHIKWLGQGITGSLFDIEAVFSQSQTSDTISENAPQGKGLLKSSTSSLALGLLWHPAPFHVKVTVPLLMKQGNLNASTYRVGPLGDISIDINRKWGQSGLWGSALVLSLPTGRSDIPEPSDRTVLANPEVQLGSGVFGMSMRFSGDIDRDWGMVSIGTTYSGGFFAITTDEYSFDTLALIPVSEKKSFKLSRDGAGARNDQGTVHPDNLGIFTDFIIKAGQLSHGLSCSFSLPLRNGRWQIGNSVMTDWSSVSENSAHYFQSKEEAQRYADTVHTDGAELRNVYEHPQVVGTLRDKWVVQEYTWMKQNSYPGVTFQYSIEKADAIFPLLFGGTARFQFDKGIKFYGMSFGLGIKYPIY